MRRGNQHVVVSKLCFAGAVLACAVTWVGDPAISVSLRQEQQTECNDVALIVVGDASHLRSLNECSGATKFANALLAVMHVGGRAIDGNQYSGLGRSVHKTFVALACIAVADT